MEEGYVWNSNSFADDLPFVWENEESRLVELPRQPFGDGRLYGHQNRAGDHPENALRLWKRFFDDLYTESARAPMFTTFQLRRIHRGTPRRGLQHRAAGFVTMKNAYFRPRRRLSP